MEKIAITRLLLVIAAAGLFATCSEWTDPEGLTTEKRSIESENQALYQQYLENLRSYKKSHHQLIIGWLDNSNKAPDSRAAHLEAVPDKVDIVSLMYGDNLTGIERDEMKSIRGKGTKTIYTIDYEAFRQDIENRNADIEAQNKDGQEAAEEEGTTYAPIPLVDLDAKLPEFIDAQLALLDKYEYDGLGVHFVGKATLQPDEEAAMQARQDLIFGKLQAVMSAHSDKLFIFEGAPQNVFNKEVLQRFGYIVIRTEKIGDVQMLTETVQRAISVSGVPSGNIIVSVSAFSTDKSDIATGYIVDANGVTQAAIIEMAHWVTTPAPNNFTKAGLGIYRINDDYYNAELDYKYTREAIEIINPSSKK
ncbi:MAG: glycoside hydrolase family 18 [Prevotellaceae bacterium]|jgi:hypothetical protein|nr:glycoside hydrolase family 18 [Prevotellaceae bacterium]